MKVLYCAEQFRETWTGSDNCVYPVTIKCLDDLYISARKVEKLSGRNNLNFFENVKRDIEKDGLIFPLLTVETTYRVLWDQKRKYKNRIEPLPSLNKFYGGNPHDRKERWQCKIWTVWGGSNRAWVAKELGYTHISCAELPDLATALQRQSDHRSPFQDRYYSKNAKYNESTHVTPESLT